MFEKVQFSELLGKTLEMMFFEDDSIKFDLSDGTQYVQFHDNACCEHVYLEDVIGDCNDLIGLPLLQAEEVTNEPEPTSFSNPEIVPQTTSTWTFYKLATNKGRVTLRWYGTSNGSYSEVVDLYRIK